MIGCHKVYVQLYIVIVHPRSSSDPTSLTRWHNHCNNCDVIVIVAMRVVLNVELMEEVNTVVQTAVTKSMWAGDFGT